MVWVIGYLRNNFPDVSRGLGDCSVILRTHYCYLYTTHLGHSLCILHHFYHALFIASGYAAVGDDVEVQTLGLPQLDTSTEPG